LPGETIEINNNSIVVFNKEFPEGLKLNEEYLPADDLTLNNITIKLRENEYFVLGDNREASFDSRS
jgi:type IV secretory pathway protease TraF